MKDLVSCLVELRLDINRPSSSHRDPVTEAEEIEVRYPKSSSLFKALIKLNDVRELKILIERGDFDVNQTDGDGETALHCISSAKVAELLLSKGANINAAYKTYVKPIHRASFRGYHKVVSVLLHHGADVNARLEKKMTPLHMASLVRSNYVTVGVLLANGANVNAASDSGSTPLHNAVKNNDETIVKKFLRHEDIRPNLQTIHGLTALHCAISHESPHIVEHLLNGGACIDIKTNMGNKPLDIAKLHHQAHDCPSTRLILKLIMQHIIKLKVAHGYVNNREKCLNVEANSNLTGKFQEHSCADNLCGYYNKCYKELVEIRSKLGIGIQRHDYSFSVYDLLTTNYPKYISNREFTNKLTRINIRQFEIYGNFIAEKFDRDMKRYQLLESCESFFSRLKMESNLTTEIGEKILSYLDNSDLKNLKICMDNSGN